ncbi:MAG: hypothetical protein ACJ75B_18575 [Flavisolibacter sp.]
MMLHYTIEEAISRLENPKDEIFWKLLNKGIMKLEYYVPEKNQQPITRDQIFVVASGRSTYYRNGDRAPVKPSDLLFVTVGTDFHFENFTDDFATWRMYYTDEELSRPVRGYTLGENGEII